MSPEPMTPGGRAALLAAGWVPPEEAETLKEKCEWWRDMTSGTLAVIDSHFLFPGGCSDRQRLEQIRTDLHDAGVEWESEWRSDNQRLAERVELLESSWVPPERVKTIPCPLAILSVHRVWDEQAGHWRHDDDCRLCGGRGGSGKLQIVRAE